MVPQELHLMAYPVDQAAVLALTNKPIMEQGLLVKAIMVDVLKPLVMVAVEAAVGLGLMVLMVLLLLVAL
jgi:hypothetical protein